MTTLTTTTTTAPAPAAADCHARHDASFESRWLTYLLAHFGQFCHASDLFEPADAYQRAVLRQRAHEVVNAARRLGFVVESDRQRGYMVTGHLGLPRYVRLRERAAAPVAL